jgi:hypothetical protein
MSMAVGRGSPGALIGNGLKAGTALALASSGVLGAGAAKAARRQRLAASATIPKQGGVLQVGGSINADSFDPIIDWATEGWIGS